MTSNIRYANLHDGVNDWPFRKSHLADYIKTPIIHLLGTQEGKQAQIKELESLIFPMKLVEQNRIWIDERMYPCLFYHPEHFNYIDSGDIWLSETPDVPGTLSFNSTFPRLCTWAKLEHIKTQREIVIVNTHLDHILQETRIKQVEVLVHEISKRHLKPDFLIGDFNESPNTMIMNKLIEFFELVDLWAAKKLPEETSHHGFKGEKESQGDRIDWILSTAYFECLQIALEKKSVNDVYLSDHYPLVATVVPKCK
jgi:endonuclease/exonuclease/phosphatase family metal-dependent hydrolase